MICRGQKKCTRQNASLPSAKKGTRQRRILPSAKKWHSAKYIFAECQKKGTRQRRILPSAEKWHSPKYIFAECRKKHSAKPSLSSAEKTLGKAAIPECPIKYTRQSFRHSAKCRFPVMRVTDSHSNHIHQASCSHCFEIPTCQPCTISLF